MDIEQYIEHSIPVERDIAELMFKDPVVPDLSKLKSNRKKDSRSKGGPKKDGKPRNDRGGKPSRGKASGDSDRERERREKGNPNRMPKKQREQSNEPKQTPEEREAAKLAALEKRKSEPKKAPRIPLRGRRGHEVPAVG